MNVPLWAAIPVLILVTIAAQADVRTRKIPNLITFPALLLGSVTVIADNDAQLGETPSAVRLD